MNDENDLNLDFALHDAQRLILDSPARFKIVAAGRRFGKSYLACIMLLINALKTTHTGLSGREYDLALKEVYYIAPTFEQGKKIMWPLLKILGKDVIESTIENVAMATLKNGRRISIKGSDRPDTLRGVGLSFAVLDEYAFMKENVWSAIIRPALADVEGDALFIGTPEGKNHFYDLFIEGQNTGLPHYESFQFKTLDNPTISREEVEAARKSTSTQLFKQEFEASFAEGGGQFFRPEWWKIVDSCPFVGGDFYVAGELAGFV